jgi:hypothetical protein
MSRLPRFWNLTVLSHGLLTVKEAQAVVIAPSRRRYASAYTSAGSGPASAPRTFSSRCAGLSVPTMVVCISGCEIV